MKAVVDQDLCIGCGNCEDECPEVFALGDDGFSHPVVETVSAELYGCVRDAAEACPVGAISIEE